MAKSLKLAGAENQQEEKSLTWLLFALSSSISAAWIYHSLDLISHNLYKISVLPAATKYTMSISLSTYLLIPFPPGIPSLSTFS